MWGLTVWVRPVSNHVCEELSGLLSDVGRFNPRWGVPPLGPGLCKKPD